MRANSVSMVAGLAVAAGVCLGATSASSHDEKHWWKHRHGPRYVVTGPVYYAPPPRPVYVVPRPVVVAPAPVYAPVYAPAPVYMTDSYYGPPMAPSLNINIPLR